MGNKTFLIIYKAVVLSVEGAEVVLAGGVWSTPPTFP